MAFNKFERRMMLIGMLEAAQILELKTFNK